MKSVDRTLVQNDSLVESASINDVIIYKEYLTHNIILYS